MVENFFPNHSQFDEFIIEHLDVFSLDTPKEPESRRNQRNSRQRTLVQEIKELEVRVDKTYLARTRYDFAYLVQLLSEEGELNLKMDPVLREVLSILEGDPRSVHTLDRAVGQKFGELLAEILELSDQSLPELMEAYLGGSNLENIFPQDTPLGEAFFIQITAGSQKDNFYYRLVGIYLEAELKLVIKQNGLSVEEFWQEFFSYYDEATQKLDKKRMSSDLQVKFDQGMTYLFQNENRKQWFQMKKERYFLNGNLG